MDSLRAPMASSSNSLHSEYHHESLLRDPYEIHNGRRYLREVPYPLPCDLPEMQRQNLRTLLGCKIFGRAVCSPNFGREAPARILEVGCGTGYWSAMCHDYLSRSQGARNVAFTGLDIAPVAPDLNRSGMKWKFVQHDLRRVPLPFDDGEFDLVMIKDISMTLSFGQPYQQFISECVRILRYGGSIEVWESDHIIRSLLPHPPPAPNRNPQERDLAEKTATYCLTHSTPFAPAQNRYIRQANAWMAIALDRRKLTPTPCAGIMQMLSQEPTLSAIGCRRIAVPLNELSWERGMSRTNSLEPHDSPMSTESRMKGRLANQQLTEEQCALRQTALVTVIQMIESLELVLRDASGYGSEEWSHWWTAMMASLADPNSCSLNGESLELGAWWATKQYSEY
jgi:ubiquinone/menaquinone biosynthesis C-methylase UbiE